MPRGRRGLPDRKPEIVEAESGDLAVSCPYSLRFIQAAKALGGRFGWLKTGENYARGVWFFPANQRMAVSELLVELFGHDGQGTDIDALGSELVLLRRRIARIEAELRGRAPVTRVERLVPWKTTPDEAGVDAELLDQD